MSERIKITVIEEADRDAAESVLFHDTEKTLLHTLREGGIMPPSLCGSIGEMRQMPGAVLGTGAAPFPDGQGDDCPG